VEAFYLLLNVLPRLEVKEAIVNAGIIPLLIKLVAGDNSVLVRQASQTLKSLCEVPEYRRMAVDGMVFEALTTGMQQITDNASRVAMAEAIGRYKRTIKRHVCIAILTLSTMDNVYRRFYTF